MRAPLRLATVAAAIALGLAALAACTAGGSDPTPIPSSSSVTVETSGASPTSASPSPTPPATADCSTEGIVPGRLGCLDTNLPVAGNPGESAVTWQADFCAPGDGRFVFASAPTLVRLGGHDGGQIGRIDIYDQTLTTAEGIHVGSTAPEVAAAYPATPPVTSFSGTQLVVLSGPQGFITIELADGWGTEPWTVANIRIYAADQDPNVPVYGTEDFAGACPLSF
ncbi:MAG: hypothetical protein HGA51_04450 [Demequinaceae bacterium]|nr:hypothetical protein [Demequinaceae bacterium]